MKSNLLVFVLTFGDIQCSYPQSQVPETKITVDASCCAGVTKKPQGGFIGDEGVP